MRQTALKRGKPRRSQPKRDWTAAREKVEAEGQCRVWSHNIDATGCEGALEAAHVIGREHDLKGYEGDYGRVFGYTVEPVRIIPLCTKHHRLYDAHQIDVLPVLTLDEQIQAVRDAGGLELARKRLAPSCYREAG